MADVVGQQDYGASPLPFCRVGIETSLLARSATAVLCVRAYETPGKGVWLGFARE